MKKLFLSFVLSVAGVLVAAATSVQIGDFYYELSGTSATLTQHASYKQMTQAIIPPSVNSGGHDYNVTKIASSAFSGCTELLTVSIPSSVTYVGNNAFENCTWLDSVAWHPVRMYDTNYATNTFPFYNDKKIRKFTFGPTVQRIPAYLCYGLSNIVSLEFPSGLEFIGANAFCGLTKITEVVLPEGFNSAGRGVFNACSNLASINIPSSLTYISDYFLWGTAITEIDIPSTVTSIGVYALAGTKLQSVTIPEGVTEVGDCAFNCQYLKTVVWNAKEATCGTATNTNPFYNTKLDSIIFGPKVTYISPYLCYDQNSLTKIYNYSETPQAIKGNVFYNVDKSNCVLYVPIDYVDLYQAKDVWKEFQHIIGVATDLQFDNQTVEITYLKKDETPLYMEAQNWQIPHAPRIDGFTFVKWQVLAGDLDDGIVLQAVYESDTPTLAPEVFNPANPAQKLIREGDVYILRDDKLYTITGANVTNQTK